MVACTLRICALVVLVVLSLLPRISAAAGTDPLWLRGGHQPIGNHLLMTSPSNDGGGFKAYRFSDGALLSLNVEGGAGGTLTVSPAGGVFATFYNRAR